MFISWKRQGADIQTKVEELEELNQSLRQRDKVKDDAIAQLSDQLVSLSARLQEIERRQDVHAALSLHYEQKITNHSSSAEISLGTCTQYGPKRVGFP